MVEDFRGHLERTAAERPVLVAFIVFVVATLIVGAISIPYYFDNSTNFWENIVAEAHGVLFDLLIIGWFLLWLNKIAEHRTRNNRYREEIEDYIGWHSPEATLRIVGNIRRLNRGGVKNGFRLTEVFLEGAKLSGAEMSKTDLWGAQLENASLREAMLDGSNLAGANLENADLERCSLRGTDLRGSNMNEADLERAVLSEADMRGVSLVGADLQYAVLNHADLRRCKLTGANLRGANFDHAILDGASLEGAHLRGATLRGASLREVDMTGADLIGVDFTRARLPAGDELIATFEKAKSLYGAAFDTETQRTLRSAMPTMFDMPESTGIPDSVIGTSIVTVESAQDV